MPVYCTSNGAIINNWCLLSDNGLTRVPACVLNERNSVHRKSSHRLVFSVPCMVFNQFYCLHFYVCSAAVIATVAAAAAAIALLSS